MAYQKLVSLLIVFCVSLRYQVRSAPRHSRVSYSVSDYVRILDTTVEKMKWLSFDVHKKYNATYFDKKELTHNYLRVFSLQIVEMATNYYTTQEKNGKTAVLCISRIAKLSSTFNNPMMLVLLDEKHAGSKLFREMLDLKDMLKSIISIARKLYNITTGKIYYLSQVPNVTKQTLDKKVIQFKNQTRHMWGYFNRPVNKIRNWSILYEIEYDLIFYLKTELNNLRKALNIPFPSN